VSLRAKSYAECGRCRRPVEVLFEAGSGDPIRVDAGRVWPRRGEIGRRYFRETELGLEPVGGEPSGPVRRPHSDGCGRL
jgi:hypothetical protein